MGIPIADNFNYQGKKMLDVRMYFKSKDEMKNFPAVSLPKLFIALCEEDSKLYMFKEDNPIDPETGKWEEYVGTARTYVVSDEPPQDMPNTFWIGKKRVLGIADNPMTAEDIVAGIRGLNTKLEAIMIKINAMADDIAYLKTHGSIGGGSSDSDVDGILLLENGDEFILENGDYLAIE